MPENFQISLAKVHGTENKSPFLAVWDVNARLDVFILI